MTRGKALDGKPCAGNPHARFDEGASAPAATPRRGSLLYKKITRKSFLGGITAAAAACGGGCAFALADPEQRMVVPVDDWKPAARWRGFNLLGMFRCPSIGLKPAPRVEGHFVEWEFKALREWGVNFARLPLDYRILIAEDNWLELDERKMKHLDDAITWGRKHAVHEQTGTSLAWNVPAANGRRVGPQVEVFARIKAYAADGCGETLFSQPFMLV